MLRKLNKNIILFYFQNLKLIQHKTNISELKMSFT